MYSTLSVNHKLLTEKLEIAKGFGRFKGLLGRTKIAEDEMLWIPRCNSIHMFFMRFAIDCVFLNTSMQAVRIVRKVSPGTLVWPVRYATSVIEMQAGAAEKFDIKVGDIIHVGT